MSVEVMSWVLRHSEEKVGRRLVLLSLADHANADGTGAWPSVETIAHEARLSRRQTQTCLRGLVAAGAIVEAGKSPHGTVVYNVIMGGAESSPPADEGGAERDAQGVRNVAEGGAETSPEPSLSSTIQEQPPFPPTSPPAAVKVDGRNLGWDALAEECGIIDGDPRAGEVATALHGRDKTGPGIRGLFWQECIRYVQQNPQHQARLVEVMEEPERFERALESAIHTKAALYHDVMQDALLTPGALRKWWVSIESQRVAQKRGLTPEEIERFGVAL